MLFEFHKVFSRNKMILEYFIKLHAVLKLENPFKTIFTFQRINDLCKRMGISEDVIQRKLQGFLSMDSLDGVLLAESNEENCGERLTSTSLPLTKSFDSDNNHTAGKSDTESGFDESSSQLSRSGFEDGLGSSTISLTGVLGNSEPLTRAQFQVELSSVAVDWKPLRNVQNCSCAYSFEHFSKKVSVIVLLLW